MFRRVAAAAAATPTCSSAVSMQPLSATAAVTLVGASRWITIANKNSATATGSASQQQQQRPKVRTQTRLEPQQQQPQQAAPSSSARPPPVVLENIENSAVLDLARATHRKGGKLPLGAILALITAKSKDVIFKSGKGIEGFVRGGVPAINVIEEKGVKYIVSNIVDPSASSVPAAEDGAGDAAAGPSQVDDASNSSLASSSSGSACMPSRLRARSRLFPIGEPLPARVPFTEHELGVLEIICDTMCRGAYAYSSNVLNATKIRTVPFADFIDFVEKSGRFWVINGGQHMRVREANETIAPAAHESVLPAKPQVGKGFAKIQPSPSNNWGGWGGQANVPTAEDVFEILKYIPIHWGNLGCLNVPPPVKKKHIRIASFLQWLRRQPKFFEVRNVAGTLEVRRAIVLHPEHHGKTFEEAEQWLLDRIGSGEHNAIVSSAETMGTNSLAASAIYKFMVRVTPGYFVSPELVLMRYTKKGLSVTDLAQVAREYPAIFEMATVGTEGSHLIRRRTGADSSKWRDIFLEDVSSVPADVEPLAILMGRSSVCWDRPEYLYVRLLDSEKIAVGGYEHMLEVMRRHPQVFRMGEVYFRRVDHSDPSNDDPEPTVNEERVYKRAEENVYHGHRDIATIFHYISPDDGVVDVGSLNDCASPAIQAELPPRIVSVLQMFPDLFNCKETSPGMFTIRKIVPRPAAAGAGGDARKPAQYGSGFFYSTGNANGAAVGSGASASVGSGSGSASASAAAFDDMMMGDDDDDAEMTRKETVEAIKGLIPARGVDVAQLSQWLSMDVRKAVEKHFESLQGLFQFNRDKFSVDGSNVVTVIAGTQ